MGIIDKLVEIEKWESLEKELESINAKLNGFQEKLNAFREIKDPTQKDIERFYQYEEEVKELQEQFNEKLKEVDRLQKG